MSMRDISKVNRLGVLILEDNGLKLNLQGEISFIEPQYIRT
jgi:hypothetical protein